MFPDIPMDPIDYDRKWETSGILKKIWLGYQTLWGYLTIPLSIVVFCVNIVLLVIFPNDKLNWVLALLYFVIFVLQLTLKKKPEKAWGVVYDVATNGALPLTTVQLIQPEFSKIVKSRLTDYQGRYSFMPQKGEYVIKATKPGYVQTSVVDTPRKDRQPVSGKVTIKKDGQRFTGDIPMHQGYSSVQSQSDAPAFEDKRL